MDENRWFNALHITTVVGTRGQSERDVRRQPGFRRHRPCRTRGDEVGWGRVYFTRGSRVRRSHVGRREGFTGEPQSKKELFATANVTDDRTQSDGQGYDGKGDGGRRQPQVLARRTKQTR
jgi:hypothetical protein